MVKMDSKKNMVLLGLIVALIGVLSIFINLTGVTVFDLMLFAAGAALLLLYRTKRKSWSLILGGYLAYFGFSQVLNNLTRGFFSEPLFIAMFFIVPALIFFVLYFDKNKRGLLIPASLLFWLGLHFILRDIRIPFALFSNFYLYMAAAFFTIFMFAKNYMGKWPLYTSIVLLVIGAFEVIISVSDNLLFTNYGILGPVAVVLAGVVIVITALLKNRNNRKDQ